MNSNIITCNFVAWPSLTEIKCYCLFRSLVQVPMYEIIDLPSIEPINDTSSSKPLQHTSDVITKRDSCSHASENVIDNFPTSNPGDPAEYIKPTTTDKRQARSSEVEADNTYQPLIPPQAQQATVSSEYQSLMGPKLSVVTTTDEENTYQPLIPLRAHRNTASSSTEYQSLTQLREHPPPLQLPAKCQSSADSESPPPIPPKTMKVCKQ